MVLSWILARRGLRSSRGRAALVVLVIAITTASVMFAAAGARRTATAFDRFEAWARAPAIITGGGGFDRPVAEVLPRLAALPEVADTVLIDSPNVSSIVLPDLSVVSPPTLNVQVPRDDRIGTEIARSKLIEGRFSSPERADEAMVSFVTADRFHLSVGDTLTIRINEWDTPELSADVRLVGIYSFPDEFPGVGNWIFSGVSLTPAFAAAHPDWMDPYAASMGIYLRPGVSGAEFRDAVSAAGDPEIGRVDLLEREGALGPARRVVRLEASALWWAALLAAVTGTGVLFQLLRREAALVDVTRGTTLRALGVTRRGLTRAAALAGSAQAVVGAALGAVAAVVLSPLAPVGLARYAEVEPGVRVDTMVLVLGALATVVGVAVLSAVAASLAQRHRAVTLVFARTRRAVGGPDMAAALVLAGLGDRGPVGREVRRGRWGVALSASVLVATVVVIASLRLVAGDADLAGGSWDAFLTLDDGDRIPAVAEAVARDPRVEGVSRGGWTDLDVDGHYVYAQVLESDGPLRPAIARGRAAVGDGEIVLGRVVMRELGVGVGDVVRVRAGGGEAPARPVRVVGEVIVTSTLFQSFAPDGAAVITTELHRAVDPESVEQILVSFRPGIDPEVGLIQLRDSLPEDVSFSFSRAQRGDVIAIERLSGLARALLAFVLVLAASSLLHLVAIAVRRNAPTLAVLRALGCTTVQLGRSGAVLGALVVVAALVGVPVGLAAGMKMWGLVARSLPVVARFDLAVVQLSAMMVTGLGLALIVGAALVLWTSRRDSGVLRTG